MKKKGIVLVFVAMFFLFLSGSVFAVSHTIASTEILSFQDPDGLVINDPTGSAILSWSEGVSGISGGFCDVTLYAPFPDGGKYEVSLTSVIFSNDAKLKGIWDIKKNGTSVIVMMGEATGLNNSVGGLIEIKIDGFTIIIKIQIIVNGVFPPDEITGQAIVDGVPLAGAVARIQGGGSVLAQMTTDMDGNYLFIYDPLSDVKRIVIVFKNFDSNIVISGYVYTGGVPLAGATVMIKEPGGTDLAVVTTDADGYYETPPILNAVGINLRTIIVK